LRFQNPLLPRAEAHVCFSNKGKRQHMKNNTQ
jgi:hypothetical protein